ncbi:MAG: zf-HC2 domain-containing protein [Jatrophihabitans sp.]|nr:MAG: zf-HC2 domain-containing protein [Jatrophihabitans sp.]
MITMVRGMLTCRWAARRIQHYLDADPAAHLDAVEVARLEAHLAACARCGGRADQYRALAAALRSWSDRNTPDPRLVARMHDAAERIVAQGSA